jgi:Zn-dependent alcohol dehydrogenase
LGEQRAFDLDAFVAASPPRADLVRGPTTFSYDMPRLIDFYLGGRLDLHELVSPRIPLAESRKGVVAMMNGSLMDVQS